MKSKRKKFWSGDNRRVTSVLLVKFGPDFESISCNKRLTAIRRNFATAKTFTELVSAGRRGLEGQTHDVAPEAVAPVLREFFSR
jgi:hypothetical protein